MALYATPLAELAVELLEDGEWHDAEEVLQALMKLVPPGKALRRAERQRVWMSGTRHGTEPPKERVQKHSTQRLIEIGARPIAKGVLVSPHYEHDNGRVRMVSMPPGVANARKLRESGRMFRADDVADRLLALPPQSRQRALDEYGDRRILDRLVLELLARIEDMEIMNNR